jgi:replicative DNA helicase
MSNEHDIELGVLGSVLVDNQVLNDIKLILEPDDFLYLPARHLYKAMLEMGTGIDILTLNAKTKNRYTDIILKCSEVPTSANAVNYAEIVKEASNKRKVQNELKRTNDNLKLNSVEDILPDSLKKLASFSEDNRSTNYHKVNALTNPVVNDMLQRKVETRGAKTHINGLDKALGCLRNGDLIVIGARPGMGKSALVLSVILNMAINGDPVILFSLEMSKEQLVERLLCQLSGVSMQDMNLKMNMDENSQRIIRAAQILYGLPIYINDNVVKYNKIEHISRQAKKKLGIKAVFIDYLQLISTTKLMGDNRNQQLGYVTRNLKKLAKELNMPITLLAQLNRGLEQRTNKRPMLSDLRDSGEIEQDVDVAMLLYRDEIYNKNSEHAGTVEIDIAKARNLSPAWVRLAFIAHCMKFADLQNDRERG